MPRGGGAGYAASPPPASPEAWASNSRPSPRKIAPRWRGTSPPAREPSLAREEPAAALGARALLLAHLDEPDLLVRLQVARVDPHRVAEVALGALDVALDPGDHPELVVRPVGARVHRGRLRHQLLGVRGLCLALR